MIFYVVTGNICVGILGMSVMMEVLTNPVFSVLANAFTLVKHFQKF
jgi:hypothetical protein